MRKKVRLTKATFKLLLSGFPIGKLWMGPTKNKELEKTIIASILVASNYEGNPWQAFQWLMQGPPDKEPEFKGDPDHNATL